MFFSNINQQSSYKSYTELC